MSEKEFWTPPAREPEKDKASAPEPFLRRWSRLKGDPAAREDEAPAQPPAPAPAPDAGAGDAPDREAADAPGEQVPAADEDLPPLEMLDEHSDYSGFMSPRVSEALRKQALRKLFRSQKFNYICELDDYIDDYTSFPALGDMVTADMKHAAERLLKKQLEAEEADAAAAAAAAPGTDEKPDALPADAETETGTADAGGPEESQRTADAAGDEPDAATDTSEDKPRDA